MQFTYVGYTSESGVRRGRIEARDNSEAWAEVTRMGLKPLSVSPARRMPSLEQILPFLFQVGTGELVRFSRQLATMVASGGGLMDTLKMLQAETRNRTMRRIIQEIYLALNDGSSLSDAMRQHPKVFNTLFISVVEVGEYSGRLGPALEQVSDSLEKENEARQKAKQAMMYPMAIMGLSLLTMFVLMTVALPPLLKVFEQLDADIPLMTRIAVSGAEGIKNNMTKIPLFLIALIFIVIMVRRNERTRYWMDAIRVKLPVIGAFTVSGELARFARTIAVLLDAGVPLSTALQVSRTGCGNAVIRKAFVDADEAMMSGEALTTALHRHPVLPTMFVQLVTIGEESNSLPKTMREIADTYEKQHDRTLTSVLGMLEPASTVVVGGIVGFIAMSMFVPIYSGISAIG